MLIPDFLPIITSLKALEDFVTFEGLHLDELP